MWKHFHPTEVLFGEGMSGDLGKIMAEKGFDRAVMVCDPFTETCGLAERLTRAADGRIAARFSDIEPNPSLQNVDGAAEAMRAAGAKCVGHRYFGPTISPNNLSDIYSFVQQSLDKYNC